MNKSKIEWTNYTVNPVKGVCPARCSYCYARRLYERFHWDPAIRWWPPAFDLLDSLKKPSRIFVGSTMELFHPSLPENWMEYNQRTAMKYPQHTFIFLTKKSENLPRSWPDNCWVGVTATGRAHLKAALYHLASIDARVRFLSLEPLLEEPPTATLLTRLAGAVDWLIIGQLTPVSQKTAPKIEWIREIVDAADKAGVPVFLKNNLFDLLDRDGPETNFAFDTEGQLRQELPNNVATKATGHNNKQTQEGK